MAKEAIKKGKDYADSIVESIPDPLIVVSPNGTIRAVNLALYKLLGYTKEELEGRPVDMIFAEDYLFKGAGLERLLKEGSIKDYDTNYLTKAGRRVPVSFSGSVMRDEKGKILGVAGVGRDIRETKKVIKKLADTKIALISMLKDAVETTKEFKKAKARLHKAHTELKQTQTQLIQSGKMAAIGQLAAGVAHEINNPLATIALNIHRIRDKLAKEDANIQDLEDCEWSIKRIITAYDRCAKIVSTLLDFSRPPEVEFESLYINSMLREILFLAKRQLKLARIKVVQRYGRGRLRVWGDADQLKQVFLNIILNAIAAMPEGGSMTIATELLPKKHKVEVRISDTGVGIPKENIGQIFNPFFTTRPVGEGVGLGLTIAYTIVERHKGSIDVTSEVGKGTTFSVRLPIR